MARNYRLISALLALSACAQMANADVSNQIYAVDQTASPSQTVTIPINMKNSVEATAYSFSIKLPEGVEPKNVTLAKSAARKAENVVFDYAVQSDNSIMALCYSTDGTKFSGNDGEVATVTFDVPASMAADNYDIVINESEISESGIAYRVSDKVTSVLSVSSPSPFLEIELKDKESYTAAEDREVAKVTYTRVFDQISINRWQPLYIPFAFDVKNYIADFDVAEIMVVAPLYDTNDIPGLDAGDDPYMVVSMVRENKTYANAPYVIRPKKANICIEAENCILHKADINEVKFSTSRTEYTIIGLYEPFVLQANDHNYYIANDGIFYYRTAPGTMRPNRWIMHEETKSYIPGVEAEESQPKSIGIRVIGEDIDEETALQFIQADAIQSCAGTDNVIYNLNGVRVDDTTPLPAGIYVKNGKTFMIR